MVKVTCRVELGRYFNILIYCNIHWHNMISIPSVQLSIWQVKVHVCFYCACSEQLPRGVVRTLTASWLRRMCTMDANAGASENRIVPNKSSKSPVWTYFGFPCDVDGAVNKHKVFCCFAIWSCHIRITLRTSLPIFRHITRPSILLPLPPVVSKKHL